MSGAGTIIAVLFVVAGIALLFWLAAVTDGWGAE